MRPSWRPRCACWLTQLWLRRASLPAWSHRCFLRPVSSKCQQRQQYAPAVQWYLQDASPTAEDGFLSDRRCWCPLAGGPLIHLNGDFYAIHRCWRCWAAAIGAWWRQLRSSCRMRAAPCARSWRRGHSSCRWPQTAWWPWPSLTPCAVQRPQSGKPPGRPDQRSACRTVSRGAERGIQGYNRSTAYLGLSGRKAAHSRIAQQESCMR